MSSNDLTTDTGYQGLTGPFVFPIGATLSHQLSWSHIVELLKIDDPLESAREEKP